MLEHRDAPALPHSLVDGHLRFLQNDFAVNERLFSRLASEGQKPKVMWIGCSDSRVAPERIMGAEPGELFILRNVANIVPPLEADEASVGSALVFAVEILDVDHLVVCGHSDCGGIKALSQLGRASLDPMLSSWIEYAIPALEDCKGSDPETLTKTNVLTQSERLMEYACVAEAVNKGRLAVHACYYDLGSGGLELYHPSRGSWESFEQVV